MIRNTILAFVAALTVAAGLSVSTASAADSRSSYTNGCTLSPDGIPGFYNFRDICNQHDVCYARFSNGSHQYGTNEWGRLTCDNQFSEQHEQLLLLLLYFLLRVSPIKWCRSQRPSSG